MPHLDRKREQLLDLLRTFESVAVAFSAGVDSTVVAKAARLALGDRAIAVTGESESLASGELDEARQLAEMIGIRHETVATRELENDAYAANAPDRCYHCKTQLYTCMTDVARRFGARVLVNGTNVEDMGDYRPGLVAAAEFQVRSPLAECGIDKTTIRELAAYWELPIWDKPATPCLSSRIAYGEQVTPERLRMIDDAEQFLRDLGVSPVRVRYHGGDMARIEAPLEALGELIQPTVRDQLVFRLRACGFRFVALDLEGFRSGSLNSLVPLDVLSDSSEQEGQ